MPFPSLIVAPVSFPGSDIGVLPLLGTAREQYNQPVTVLAKIDPITVTEIYPELIDAGTYTFHIRGVALLHPMDGCRYLDRSGHIQTINHLA
jgi:hypothetical protein